MLIWMIQHICLCLFAELKCVVCILCVRSFEVNTELESDWRGRLGSGYKLIWHVSEKMLREMVLCDICVQLKCTSRQFVQVFADVPIFMNHMTFHIILTKVSKPNRAIYVVSALKMVWYGSILKNISIIQILIAIEISYSNVTKGPVSSLRSKMNK